MNRAKYWAEVMIGKRQHHGFPIVTAWLILACCVIWVLQNLTGGQLLQFGAMHKALAPLQPWRYLSYMFLHAPLSSNFIPLHLLLNMYSLWVIGRILESYLGSLKFLIGFVICGLGASVFPTALAFINLHISNNADFTYTSIGASGAIMGLFAVLIFLFRRLQLPYNQLLIVLVINLAFPFFIGGIDWIAHICGFATGAILALGLGFTGLKLPDFLNSKQLFYSVIGILLGVFVLTEFLIVLLNY
jgi:membrane associated rhomboid family serine protease